MFRSKKALTTSEKTRRMTQLALLFALAVVLMVVENLIPPIPSLPPGVKLGLSNIVVMFCLFHLGQAEGFTVLILKSGFVFLIRGFTAFLLSFSGGFCSILVMILLLLLKKTKISYIIVSMCASVTHNMAQLVVSSLLLGTSGVFYYSPILIISGMLMGALTGTVLWVTMPAMKMLNRTKIAGIKTRQNGVSDVDIKE